MIAPSDKELILAMVGEDFVTDMPDDFLHEYHVRLAMLHRAGHPANMGAVGMMQLLRDFKVNTGDKPEEILVSDWSKISPDTPILYQGRPARFRGLSGNGMMHILLDGYRGMHEVPIEGVTLRKSVVRDVDDSVFEETEEITPQQQALLDEEKVDPLLKQWGHIESNTPVIFDNGKYGPDGKEAVYMDIRGDDQIVLLLDGKKTVVKAENVRLPEPAS